MKPAIAAMATRKKDVSDLIRRGVNPILAEKTQFMQKNNTFHNSKFCWSKRSSP